MVNELLECFDEAKELVFLRCTVTNLETLID